MDQPTTIPQLRHKLEDSLRLYERRELALTHLMEAVVKVRHHQKPSAKIAASLKELHPEWHTWVNSGNEAKFEPWKLHISGNGLDGGNDITVSISYTPDWDKFFAEVQRYDFSKQKMEIQSDLENIDTYVDLENEAVAALEAVQAKMPGGWHFHVTSQCFPLLFTKHVFTLGYTGTVRATKVELERIGIFSMDLDSNRIVTMDGRVWKSGNWHNVPWELQE